MRDLNTLYRAEPALHVKDCEPEGFQWIEANDAEMSCYAWARYGRETDRPVVVLLQFQRPPNAPGWQVGLPRAGRWREALNTGCGDFTAARAGGNLGGGRCDRRGEAHGQPASAPCHATATLHGHSGLGRRLRPVEDRGRRGGSNGTQHRSGLSARLDWSFS